MGNCQLMENFMPSEIARLVLGYLKETSCMKSWRTFLSESPHLREYEILYKEGKEYPTNVGGMSLLVIVQRYYVAASKGSQVENQDASSMLHVKERTLFHSRCIAPPSSTTVVTPMDTSETNNCSDLIVTCASSSQIVNPNTESIHKQLPASHCQQYNCPSDSLIQSSQTTRASSVNCSQIVHVTQCHQQGLRPQIGVSTYLNHNCQFSTTTTTSQSTMPIETCVNKTGTIPSSGKKMPISASHNKSRTIVTSANIPQNTNTIPRDITSLASAEHFEVNRISSEKKDNCENSSPKAVSLLPLHSNSSHSINTALSNTVGIGISRTMECSPHTFLSQQRLLPSLNTPMKELGDLEEYFCSPKRKSLLPRRRLLSSFSPAQVSTPCTRIAEEVELPNEEATDYNAMLMEEFFKCTPLLEKIAENINKVVSTEQNQMSPSAKQIMDSDLPFPAQVSQNHESLIKDIVTRTESDPAFEDFFNSICEKVDSSKDGFENAANIQNEQSESNRESSAEQQNKVLKQTEVVHCGAPNVAEGTVTRKENEAVENSVKEKPTQRDNIITSSAITSSSTVTVHENVLKNNIESSKPESPTGSTRKVTENCMSSSLPESGNEKTLTSQIENTVTTNPNSVVLNEKLTATQNASSIALVTDLSGNIIQTITTIPESSVVLPTSNILVNSNALVSQTRQPVTITTPSFQFLTLSPRQLYTVETPASLAAKKVPGRVQPIQCKPLVSSDQAVVTRNSFVDGSSHKPVNRIPKNMLRRGPPRHTKPNILKTPVVQGQVAASCNDNSSASLSSQNNTRHNSNSAVRVIPKQNSCGAVETSNSNKRSKIRSAEKTSPRLKSLVTSAQTIAGNAFLNNTHKRVLDFGVVANSANQATNVNHGNKYTINNIEGTTMQNRNQLTFAVDNMLEGLAGNGEIVIYFESPEIVTNDGTVTIPLNNGSETVPAYLSYTPETNTNLVADSNIIVAHSSTQDVVAQNQIVLSQETTNSDSEIAETLVNLANSIPDSERTSNKNSTNKEPVRTVTASKKVKRPPRKRELRPKRRKLE